MFSCATQSIKGFLTLFGLEVHRLPRINGVVVQSAIEYNSKESGEKWYSTTKSWKDYLYKYGGNEYYSALLHLLKEKGINCNGKHVADMGCGTGHLLLKIHKNYDPATTTGTDIIHAALDIARSTVPEADILYCDLLAPDLNRKFDIIFCTEVFEHLVRPGQALKNLLGMLNSSGIAIVTVPNGRLDTYHGHINFWSPESWEIFIKDVCNGHDIETGLWLRSRKNFAIIKLV
jgi:2-polyprenyl-3-methyl-5-hydroxy-6-metoxy-1,4-benzoquinol methylase